MPRRLAVAQQPVLDRLAGRGAPAVVDPGCQRPARQARAASAIRSTDSRSRHETPSQSSTPASRCSGDGSAGQLSRDRRPRAVDHRRPPAAAAGGTLSGAPMSRRKRERLRVAAEQHVLAVVDELAGCRDRGTTVARPPSRALASSTSTRAPRDASRTAALRPAEPGADDDHVVACSYRPQPLPQRDQRLLRTRHARRALKTS